MNNRQKSKRILVFGLISQVVTLLLGILLPKLLIGGFGSEVNGLLSSIRQIFVYVALLEAGVGTAALQALYAPVAKGDRDGTSAIMAATDRYFRRTGVLYALAVLILAFAYPYVFHVELDAATVAAVIMLQGSAGVIRYFFQGKLVILLRVDGRSYVTTNIQTAVTIASYAAQITLILLGCDIIAVQIAYFLTNLCQMLYMTRYVKKHYPWLNLSVKPDFKALGQSKFVIVHQLSSLVFYNTDMIVLTYFCGLKTVSVYALYNLIFNSIGNVIDTLCGSVEFVLGQAYNSDRQRYVRLQEAYETYYLGFAFALFSTALIMVPSFMEIYAGGFTDANYTDRYLPWLFAAVNILMYARRTSSQVINFAGAFKQTQWRSILESAINLVVSLVMVQHIGIYGVLVGTIAALFYRTNDVIIFANCTLLHRLPWQTYKRWLVNMAWMMALVLFIGRGMPVITSFFVWGLVAAVVMIGSLLSFAVIDTLFDIKSMGVIKEMVKR